MAFIAINTNLLDVGDPIKKEILDLVKDNFDDHESRIVQVESVISKIDVFNDVVYNASVFSTALGIIFFQASNAFTLTEAKITIFEKGSLTGFLEVDIKKNTSLNPAGFASVMTTRPLIDYSTAASYDDSTNAVFDNSAKNILPGDWLRLDITQAPTGGVIPKFNIQVFGEV